MQTGKEKREERARALARRAAAFAAHGGKAGARLAEHGLAFLSPRPGSIISGFSAIRDEIDPGALLKRLRAEGHRLSLPVMQGKERPLLFRAWSPGDEMGKVQWGIAEPLPDKPALDPDIVLVPLLAFDAAGYRLGYGGGFYDRSLERLRAIKPVIAVGIAYDELKVDAVPHQSYDERLDWVLTPSGPQRCPGP
ncbi:MAG: 5-formyltetrahydrofolate cyclo-ligase [Hyphomicrobium sp.]|jgi:5-formyltetrahydrofolate cyclo-ligase